MKKLMNLIMLSCQKATELIEKKILVNLSFREGVQLKMHKILCDACTAYEKQSKLIDQLLSKHIQNQDDCVNDNEEIKNEELKKKILKKIK